MNTITEQVGLLVVTRCWCGIQHAVPQSFLATVRSDSKKSIFCPLGHSGSFSETETDQLRKQLANETAKLLRSQSFHDQTKAALQETERKLIAQKGATTRIKNRVKHGVCPCCKRTFGNLANHMNSQHPDFE